MQRMMRLLRQVPVEVWAIPIIVPICTLIVIMEAAFGVRDEKESHRKNESYFT